MTAAERGTQEDRRPSALGWPEPVSRETSNGAPATEANVSRETATSAATRQPRPAAPGEPWPRPASRRIITTANQKGGVGKTTTAVNVAAAMSQHGLRVLVIDLDPQGNASTAFDVPHQSGAPSSYDVLVEGRPLTDVAVEVDGLPGLCCVPATIDLAGAEIELVSVVAREFRLRRAIEALDDRFDYVFLDCPPSLGLLTLNAMVGAAEVMIPIQCEFYALEGLSQLLANIDLVKAELNPRLRVSTIVLTMYDGRTRLADQVVAEVRGHFGPLVVDTIVPRSVRVSEAPGFGQPVISFDPGSRGARAYAAVAHEIVQQDLTQEVAR
ncbi:MAG TPA: ParA family protein [Mycobacteriales bacterium]|nr:ParA family protein [Mycobacteriales bacterium]